MSPRFSSDGTEIVFLATSPNRVNQMGNELLSPWSIRPDGSHLHRVMPDAVENYGPITVTPDEIIGTRQDVGIIRRNAGESIGYGPRRVVSIPIDGGQPRPLPIPDGATEASPAPQRRASTHNLSVAHQFNIAYKLRPLLSIDSLFAERFSHGGRHEVCHNSCCATTIARQSAPPKHSQTHREPNDYIDI